MSLLSNRSVVFEGSFELMAVDAVAVVDDDEKKLSLSPKRSELGADFESLLDAFAADADVVVVDENKLSLLSKRFELDAGFESLLEAFVVVDENKLSLSPKRSTLDFSVEVLTAFAVDAEEEEGKKPLLSSKRFDVFDESANKSVFDVCFCVFTSLVCFVAAAGCGTDDDDDAEKKLSLSSNRLTP